MGSLSKRARRPFASSVVPKGHFECFDRLPMTPSFVLVNLKCADITLSLYEGRGARPDLSRYFSQ